MDYAYSCQVLSALTLKAISNVIFASEYTEAYTEVFWKQKHLYVTSASQT